MIYSEGYKFSQIRNLLSNIGGRLSMIERLTRLSGMLTTYSYYSIGPYTRTINSSTAFMNASALYMIRVENPEDLAEVKMPQNGPNWWDGTICRNPTNCLEDGEGKLIIISQSVRLTPKSGKSLELTYWILA